MYLVQSLAEMPAIEILQLVTASICVALLFGYPMFTIIDLLLSRFERPRRPPAPVRTVRAFERCRHHGPAKPEVWACPTCLVELRTERDALRRVYQEVEMAHRNAQPPDQASLDAAIDVIRRLDVGTGRE